MHYAIRNNHHRNGALHRSEYEKIYKLCKQELRLYLLSAITWFGIFVFFFFQWKFESWIKRMHRIYACVNRWIELLNFDRWIKMKLIKWKDVQRKHINCAKLLPSSWISPYRKHFQISQIYVDSIDPNHNQQSQWYFCDNWDYYWNHCNSMIDLMMMVVQHSHFWIRSNPFCLDYMHYSV